MPDRTPSLADVCLAIAEGHLAVSSDGITYQVSAHELRRYFNHHHPLSILTLVQSLSDHDPNSFTASSPDLCSSGR
jgi:hypothetical protein